MHLHAHPLIRPFINKHSPFINRHSLIAYSSVCNRQCVDGSSIPPAMSVYSFIHLLKLLPSFESIYPFKSFLFIKLVSSFSHASLFLASYPDQKSRCSHIIRIVLFGLILSTAFLWIAKICRTKSIDIYFHSDR